MLILSCGVFLCFVNGLLQGAILTVVNTLVSHIGDRLQHAKKSIFRAKKGLIYHIVRPQVVTLVTVPALFCMMGGIQ